MVNCLVFLTTFEAGFLYFLGIDTCSLLITKLCFVARKLKEALTLGIDANGG